ncbi:MAG: tetratricopeptide repeat protein, partial [Bacteroidetes bacterium]|nr:tetratricopeptide repeat protein [Bacteroidota bacterium]
MKLLLSIIFSFYLVFYATAGRIDSLKSELAKAVHDTVKIKLLNSIGFIMETDYPDSSAEYYRQVYDLALRLKKSKKKEIVETGEMYELLGLKNAGYVLFRQGNIEQAIGKFLTAANIMEALLSQKDDPIKKQAMRKDLGNCYNTIGVFYDDWGIYRQALEYYIKALDIRISLKDSMAIMAQYNNIGIVHKNMGDFGLAIENYQKAVKICGNLAGSSDTSIAIAARSKQASCLNNIGTIYAIQEIFDRAEQYYSEALQIQRLLNNKSGTADCYNNIGILNWQNAKRNSVIAVADSLYDVAIENFVKSMEVFTEIGDKEGISDAYNNLGIVYRNRGSNTKALEYYRKSLEIDKETGDLGGQTLVLANIASLLIFEGRYQESVEYSLRALDLARRTATLPLEKTACVNLAAAYDSLGRKSEALDYYIKYMRLKDSLFNLDKQNLIEEMEGRFQLDKKQLQIDNLNKEKALQQLELEGKENDMKRQRFMIYTFVAGFIVTLVFAALLFRLLREKRKANRLLEKQNAEINEKNEELNQQNEEISAQRDKLEELNEELIKQRKEIGELYEVALQRKAEVERQKEEITDSINYALRIQIAVLPSDKQVG